jgi:TetR/AcrR family tetracycline transcriptional repressor
MARPKIPLISRRAALEAALAIVDSEGLDALSIRRLGDALNVNGASLYHHFKNKEDILIGVTQLALADVIAPRSDSDSWRAWLPMNANRTRQALVRHPELIPLMLQRNKLGIGARELGASVRHMEQEGVPIEAIAPLIHSLELLAILCALEETGTDDRAQLLASESDTPDARAFHRAEQARGLNGDELFEALCTSVVTAVETAIQLKIARAPLTRGPNPRTGNAGGAKPAARKPAVKGAPARKSAPGKAAASKVARAG